MLIAFNATSISTDERRRETATMFAFGVPVRGAVRIAIAENVVIGALATVLGLLGGMLLVRWMINTTLPDTFPEFGVTPSLGAGIDLHHARGRHRRGHARAAHDRPAAAAHGRAGDAPGGRVTVVRGPATGSLRRMRRR